MRTRSTFEAILVLLLALIAALSLACTTSEAIGEPASTSLLLSTTEPCRVSLDGEELARLEAHATVKHALLPGEHLLTAVTSDGRRFEETLTAEGPQQVVRLRFEAKRPAAAKPKPAKGKPAEKEAGKAVVYSSVTTYELKEGELPSWVDPRFRELRFVEDSPAPGERFYELTLHGAAIERNAAHGDPDAAFSDNIPPDAFFVAYVDEISICSSQAVVNTFEPGWEVGCSFSAEPTTAVRIVVVEEDLFQPNRTLGEWRGTVGELVKKKGALRFGPVLRLSYTITRS